MHRLAHFSRDRLHELTARPAPRLRARAAASWSCCARRATWRSPSPASAPWPSSASRPQLLDAAGCRAIEPGPQPRRRAPRRRLFEGRRGRQLPRVHPPAAQGGGARRRALPLRDAQVEQIVAGARADPGRRSQRRGDRARRGGSGSRAAAERLVDDRAEASETAGERASTPSSSARRSARAPLLAAARRAPAAAAVYGYSVTAPLRHDEQHLHLEPRAALMDERYKVAISRLGNRVRVAGSAEIGGAARAAERSAPSARSTRCSTTGSRASPGAARRSAGRARGRCCPTVRRCSGRAAPKASGSTSATAAAAGRCPAARRGWSPTRSPAGRRRSSIDGLGIERLWGRAESEVSERIEHDSPRRRRGRPRAAVRRRRDAPDRGRGAARRCRAFTLMARAGEAVARLALALAPHAEARRSSSPVRATTAATASRPRRACARFGKDVAVGARSAMPPRLPADAAQAHARAREAGVADRALAASDPSDDARAGHRRPARHRRLARARAATSRRRSAASPRFAARGAPVLAVDVPSGLDPDRGQPLGDACVVADAHPGADRRPSPGLFTGVGSRLRRHGLVRRASAWTSTGTRRTPGWSARARSPVRDLRPRRHAEHKGSFGDVAVVGGAAGMAGAALLAARAAHAAGAGRVFVDLLDAERARARARLRAARADAAPRLVAGRRPAVELSTVVCGCGGGDAVRAALPRLRRPRLPARPRCRRAQRRSPSTPPCGRCWRRAPAATARPS